MSASVPFYGPSKGKMLLRRELTVGSSVEASVSKLLELKLHEVMSSHVGSGN